MSTEDQKGNDRGEIFSDIEASKMASPSSVEEAAALLGASITKIDDVHVYRTTAPPKGLHSSFSTVNPVPCSELYVRLASLANILQNHLDSAKESGKADEDITLESAVSIIPLLHKLFQISSSLALAPILLHSSSNTIPPANPLQSAIAATSAGVGGTGNILGSPTPANSTGNETPKKKRGTKQPQNNQQEPPPSPRSKNLQVPPVRILPPLCSQPIRKLWVQCLTLAHRLSPAHSLPSTNPHVLLAPYFQAASNHPRSAKSAGGTRVAGLAVLASIFQDKVLGNRYVRPLLTEIVTLCHNGLKSSGTGDVVHRLHSVQCALSVVMAWRDSSSPIIIKKSATPLVFISPNTIDDRVLQECVRLAKKGADDKYPEVRKAAAEFVSVLSSVLITEEPRMSDAKKYNVFMYMDEAMAVCLRNLDDISVGVSVAWSEALTRCICAAVEYHSKGDKVQVVDTSSGASGVGSNTSGNKNDFTSKIKAFQEARRAIGTIGSVSCVNLDSIMNFLVHQFIKVKGEGASRMGGSHSCGGRNAQAGITQTIVYLCKLQLETGGIGSSMVQDCITPSDTLNIIMKMVGSHLEQDEDTNEGSSIAPSLSDLDDSIMVDATSSPKRKTPSKATGVGGFLRNMSANINESAQKRPTDASLARMGATRVLRRGLSGIMPESMQLMIFRELATQSKPGKESEVPGYNRHQLQVALVEISNLVITLGEACSSCLEDLIPALQYCLSDSDHGVRHEAAVAFQALAVAFPSAGRKYIMNMVGEIQVHQDEVLALGATSNNSTSRVATPPPTPQKRRNRRRQEQLEDIFPPNSNVGKSLDHQYSIHGNALVLSMILHVMPQLPGGLPAELLDIIIAVADNLISSQGNANLLRNNPGAVVTCVRAGYNIISGALTMGAKATIPHLQKIFGIWMRSAALIDDESNRLEPIQSVSCVEPFITSITVFLQKNSELLLNVPDALSRIIQILEKVFPFILGYSQLEDGGSKVFTSTRLDSAKAAILEAFAWLPSGSYPTITNSIFTFASRQIQLETKNGYTCSLLDSLLSKEDDILDIRSATRTERFGQTDCSAVEEHVVALSSKCIGFSEREAVLHLQVEKNRGFNMDQQDERMPTPLHEVGTWTKPPLPSRLSKDRLLNSAIHMFAATFGSQDGHQQMSAVKMLDDLLEYSIGKRQEQKCSKNIAAALLSCLKVLSSSDVPNGSLVETSSNWMTQTAKVLVGILPIPQNHARRAAAEGLGLLAALDSAGGSRKLQSSILRALERLMVIEIADISAQHKPQTPTPTSSSAGCLLTFACIQRYASEKSQDPEETQQTTNSEGIKVGGTIPTMIMMTRLMPYISAQDSEDDSHISRTFALHSFFLLLSHSKIIESASVSILERSHILSKAVEIVESNFYSTWTTNGAELDIKSLEVEKASFEPAYFAVIIKLMAYLVPRLSLLRRDGASAASRFSSMVILMIKSSRFHSHVVTESLLFFESLSVHQRLLSVQNLSISGTSTPSTDILAIATSIFEGQKPAILYTIPKSTITGCEGSTTCLRSAVGSISSFITLPDPSVFEKITKSSTLIPMLFSLFEKVLTSREYCCAYSFRPVASPLRLERSRKDSKLLLHQIHHAFETLLCRELETSSNCTDHAIKWLSLFRSMINGDAENEVASKIFLLVGPPRWQYRHEIAQLSSIVLNLFAESLTKIRDSKHPNSVQVDIAPHIGAFIGISCTAAIATSDESELRAYQKAGLHILNSLIRDFSELPDPNDAQAQLLDGYVSQIVASVKQALAYDIDDAEDSIDTEGSRELFLMGCECLQQLAKNRLIPDTHALKRLIKTILPSKDLLAFSSYPKDADDDLRALHVKPTSFVDNRTSILLPRVASIWTIAEIYLSGELGQLQPEYFDEMKSEISTYEDVLAINSSALSIDSCRIKAVLETCPAENKSEGRLFELHSGLTFLNSRDLDKTTKLVMEKSCASMACFGLDLILNQLKSERQDNEKLHDLLSWTGRLLHVILHEFYACMEAVQALDDNETLPKSTSEIMIQCFFVLRKVLLSSTEEPLLLSIEEIRNLLSCSFNVINFSDISRGTSVSEALSQTDGNLTACKGNLPSNVVIRACSFVEAVCESKRKDELKENLLVGVLTPLLSIDEKDPSLFSDESNATVLISVLRSIQLVLKDDDDKVEVIKSLLHFTLKMQEVTNETNNAILKDSILALTLFCMSNSAITKDERVHYITKMAENGCWDAWQQCVGTAPEAMQASLRFIQDALCEHTDGNNHVEILSTIVKVLKTHQKLSAPLLGCVGPMVLELLQLYGTRQLQGTKRTTACATCMKIVMFTLSYVTSDKVGNTHSAAFLCLVFQVLVDIVSYNGLPNDRKTNPESDPSLGRMSAQFFVHILRSSPALFKECMAMMDVKVQSVLESSVRADLSGYASAAPVKKKLNLMSFKK